MSVRVFIKNRGDKDNLEVMLMSSEAARSFIETVKTTGGYEIEYDSLTDDDFKFVPWHRIDSIEVTDDRN